MRRLHVSLRVADLDRSVAFYNTLFGMEPTLVKQDYAKWESSDPPVLLSVVSRGAPGFDHLGIQSDDVADVEALHARVSPATEGPELAGCCYAESTKSWLRDPDGVAWENFTTHGQTEGFYGEPEAVAATACCAPTEPEVVGIGGGSCC